MFKHKLFWFSKHVFFGYAVFCLQSTHVQAESDTNIIIKSSNIENTKTSIKIQTSSEQTNIQIQDNGIKQQYNLNNDSKIEYQNINGKTSINISSNSGSKKIQEIKHPGKFNNLKNLALGAYKNILALIFSFFSSK